MFYENYPHTKSSTSQGEKIYRIWADCGKLYARRTKVYHLDGRDHEQDEHKIQYEACGYGLTLGAVGSRFRDAVMDAVVEFTHDFGDGVCWKESSDATRDHPDCLLRNLVFFHFVLDRWYGDWWMLGVGFKQVEGGKLFKMADAVKGEICHGAPSHLPKGTTSKEIWDRIYR